MFRTGTQTGPTRLSPGLWPVHQWRQVCARVQGPQGPPPRGGLRVARWTPRAPSECGTVFGEPASASGSTEERCGGAGRSVRFQFSGVPWVSGGRGSLCSLQSSGPWAHPRAPRPGPRASGCWTPAGRPAWGRLRAALEEEESSRATLSVHGQMKTDEQRKKRFKANLRFCVGTAPCADCGPWVGHRGRQFCPRCRGKKYRDLRLTLLPFGVSTFAEMLTCPRAATVLLRGERHS